MKILQINTVFPNGSTGKICKGISEICESNGIDNYVACAHTKNKKNDKCIAVTSSFDNHLHNRLARITMRYGCFSYFHTFLFLNKIKKINPDIIHLHNLHANYINLQLLFNYIKKNNIKVVWTLHDCWSYTGYCTHYDMLDCNKWQTECNCCPNRGWDEVTIFDNSTKMYRLKKRLFCGIKNMVLVTPSKWLYGEVKKSFLNDYTIRIISNGIDLSIFKPAKSDFRRKYGVKPYQFLLLGVAFVWTDRKGLDVFINLANRLNERYRIVLVGTNETVDKILPDSIISIHRTNNQNELAEIYSAADLFVNPTREEMFGLVNAESLACGTPVLTFNTGGSPEVIDGTCGSVVAKNDIDAMEKEIIRICETNPYSEEACLERAKAFDMNDRFKEYIDLYEEIMNDRYSKN